MYNHVQRHVVMYIAIGILCTVDVHVHVQSCRETDLQIVV